MRNRLIIVIAFLVLLTTSIHSQEEFKMEVLKSERNICEFCGGEPDDFVSIQGGTTREKQRTVFLGGMPHAKMDNEYVGYGHCIKLGPINRIEWVCQFYALYPSDTRIHVIWNGPGGVDTYTESWDETMGNSCYFFSVTTSSSKLSKGVWTVRFIMEHDNPGSGSGAEMSYSVRIF